MGQAAVNPKVERYFATSKRWREETEVLRAILLECGLDEDIKWGKACYAYEGKNIVIIQKMNSFLALMFFKGALLEDPKGVLHKPGENSNSGRRFEFTTMKEISKSKGLLKRFIREAIAINRAGLKVEKPAKQVLPTELKSKFKEDPEFKAAFAALTPGRQRGYCLYFSAPKKSETRTRRIEKYAPKILDGKGFHDR